MQQPAPLSGNFSHDGVCCCIETLIIIESYVWVTEASFIPLLL